MWETKIHLRYQVFLGRHSNDKHRRVLVSEPSVMHHKGAAPAVVCCEMSLDDVSCLSLVLVAQKICSHQGF